MMKIHFLLFTFLLLSFTACDDAQDANTDIISHEGILDIQEIKTKSGITIWLVEDHSLPIIAMNFAFKGAGAALDPADKQGLSQLASNTFDEGAGDYSSEDFQKTLNDNSISIRFVSNRDYFGGQFKTLTKHKDLAAELLHLALTEPRFEPEAVDRMRNANISRIKHSLSKPQWVAARFLNDVAYEGHPYAQNSGGTVSTLGNITPEDLHQFAKTRLSREDLHIGIMGDISAAQASAMIDNIFGALPETQDLKETASLQLQNPGKTILYEMDNPQTIIQISQQGIAKTDPDYYAAIVMNYILGGSGFGSRLMEEVREKRGLSYGIYTYLGHMDSINTLQLSTSTQNENVAQTLGIIAEEWQKMSDAPITEKELQDAQAYLVGSLPLSLTSTDKISGLLLNMQMDKLPISYLDDRSAKIEAVTTEDVSAVSQNLLNLDNAVTILVGKPSAINEDVVIKKDIPNAE